MKFQQKVAGLAFGLFALAGPIQPLSFAGDYIDIWLEAEDATIGANWSVVSSAAASGGQYLKPPSGNFFNTPPTDSESTVSFNFELDEGGAYLVHGLVKAPTGDNDSFWVRANGGYWIKWNLIEHSASFIWDEVHHQPGSGTPGPMSFGLVAGSNTLEFVNREEGTLLDKIYITNTGNDPDFVTPIETPAEPAPQPDESAPPVSSAGDDDEIWLEAEDARFGANWSVQNDSAASGGEYLEPPAGYFFDSPPNDSESRVSFNFEATGGTYLIHGLVRAPSGDSDSFWVRANGGSWIKWNLIEHSSSFIWDEIHHQPGSGTPVPTSFNLVAGSNTLEFVNREEGTSLDKIYITNTGKAPGSTTPRAAVRSDAWYKPGDLISLHFREGSEPPMLQPMVVARMFLDYFDLSYMVVGGATKYPALPSFDVEEFTDRAWGSPEGSIDTWLSGRFDLSSGTSRRERTVRLTAERWREVILSGGHIWVNNNSPMAFTKEVIDYLNGVLGVSTADSVDILYNYATIASGYRESTPAAYRDVNGNDVWRMWDVGDETAPSVLLNLTKHPEYGALWERSMRTHTGSECSETDDSGCVPSAIDISPLLSVIGVQTDEINSWADFAEFFAND